MGAHSIRQDGFIARFPGSNGDATISGFGQWSVSRNMYLGGDATVAGGNAGLHIGRQVELSVGNTLQLWPGATIDCTNDTVEPGNIFVGSPSLTSASPGVIYVGTGGTVAGAGTIATYVISQSGMSRSFSRRFENGWA